MTTIKIAGLLFSCILIGSCNLNDAPAARYIDPETIFFDYKIWGEEERPDVNCILQYRLRGPHGSTFMLNDSNKVQVDGEVIEAKNAKLSGSFYELQKPLAGFAGVHTITLIAANNKQYTEQFSFRPFSLETVLPAVIKRGDLVFNLAGLDPLDYIRIVAVDTSFQSEDINRIDTIWNGRLLISVTELQNLSNGPIILQLYREEERALQNASRRGGIIAITYGLKREFELTD